ncbi:MAG: flagellar hook-basal body complex protein FliE, partial [Gammaproteobacteria bacterium]|nr:flagellar hook-basal body complex protein FliE [Gammaproteobacteria bacterium]
AETNNQLNAADEALTQLASGHAENLHQTMLTLEQAKLSFQYLEQIRNRLMTAYQDLLREQI